MEFYRQELHKRCTVTLGTAKEVAPGQNVARNEVLAEIG